MRVVDNLSKMNTTAFDKWHRRGKKKLSRKIRFNYSKKNSERVPIKIQLPEHTHKLINILPQINIRRYIDSYWFKIERVMVRNFEVEHFADAPRIFWIRRSPLSHQIFHTRLVHDYVNEFESIFRYSSDKKKVLT